MNIKNITIVSILAFLISFVWSTLYASNIKTDESVIFFPTQAYYDNSEKTWVVPVHGWIFELETDSIWRNSIIDSVIDQLDLDKSVIEQTLFRDRMRMFLVDNERDKELTLFIAGKQIETSESTANGHFTAEISLNNAELEKHKTSIKNNGNLWLPVTVVMPEKDQRQLVGYIQVVTEQGVSVISDIDDTVKDSNVLNKKVLLKNTFTKPFKLVKGMDTLYLKWKKAGYQFHYVSSSPWQLYPALTEFFSNSGLPHGSFHLKTFRMKDKTLFDMFASPIESKMKKISAIIDRFPDRKFILVGDSGEKDPEVYAMVFEKYPGQILHIYIHDVTEQSAGHDRYSKTFEDINSSKWTIFQQPQQLLEQAVVLH